MTISRPTSNLETSGKVTVEQIDGVLRSLDPATEMELIDWWLDVRLDLSELIKEDWHI